jgi:hypothetical protein
VHRDAAFVRETKALSTGAGGAPTAGTSVTVVLPVPCPLYSPASPLKLGHLVGQRLRFRRCRVPWTVPLLVLGLQYTGRPGLRFIADPASHGAAASIDFELSRMTGLLQSHRCGARQQAQSIRDYAQAMVVSLKLVPHDRRYALRLLGLADAVPRLEAPRLNHL